MFFDFLEREKLLSRIRAASDRGFSSELKAKVFYASRPTRGLRICEFFECLSRLRLLGVVGSVPKHGTELIQNF